MRCRLRPNSILLLLLACCGGTGVVTLASDQEPGSVAVDASSVYWADYSGGISSIRRLPIGGGAPTTVFSGPVTRIAADRANLYWVGPEAVMKMPSAGGPPVLLANARFGVGIAVDGSDVFWSDDDGVHKVDAGGATATLFAGSIELIGIAASRGSVYLVKQAACPPCGHDVVKVNTSGGAAVTLVTETRPGAPDAIATDGTNVYWWLEDTGTLSKVSVAGGPPTTLFVRDPRGGIQYRIGGMAADAKGVYSALFDSLDGQGSLIRIAPQHDFAPQLGLTTLAENQWAPGSVVLDETNVYWSTAGTRMNQIVRGSICKLHK